MCIWVYGLFTDVPGDYVKKPMKECTGREITEEWLYHIGVPVEQIPELAEHSAVCVPTMMPYITAFFMPRTKGDRPDVIPDGCVNFAFLLSLIHILYPLPAEHHTRPDERRGVCGRRLSGTGHRRVDLCPLCP